MGFFQLEVIQFFIGLCIIIVCYVFIMSHRGPLLESAFGDNMKARKSFAALSSTGYFLIFTPILLFGINVTPPADYNPAKHIQHIIYFEAALIFLIGILHLGVVAIFTTIMRKTT